MTPSRQPVTIQRRILAIIMAVSAGAVLLVGTSAALLGVYASVHNAKSDLFSLASVIGENCQASITFNLPDDADKILAGLKGNHSLQYAAVFEADGRLFSEFKRGLEEPLSEMPKIDSSQASMRRVEVLVPVRMAGENIGWVYLRDDMSEARTALSRLFAAIAAIMAAALVFSYFLARALQVAISGPILRLAETARAVSQERDYTLRAAKERDDEVGVLIDAFNDMLEQIHSRDESLRDSEEKFSRAFNSSPAMMMLCTYKEGRVLDVNSTWLKVRHYRKEEVLGKTAGELSLIPPTTLGRIVTSLKNTGSARDVETVIITREGAEMILLISAELAELGGEKVVILVEDDVTEQRKMAEQLFQSQKMDAIGQLAGGVAHDFNNMLAGIIGYAELLGLKFKTQPETEKYLKGIISLSTRASELTGRLLAFARRGQINFTAADVHELAQEVTTLLERTIDKKISLRSELHAESWTVMGDPAQLQNAILNLAVNARDAMPQGGTITFATRVVPGREVAESGLLEKPERAYIEFTVRDTGTGMSGEVKKRLFEPFFTTKAVGKGTGLGLAAVYGTVKNHHGAIKVESEEGAGASFSIYLPLANGQGLAASKTGRILRRGRGRIMLVEDEPLVRRMGREMLEELGYEVIEAGNGRSAIEFYAAMRDQINLVIMDLVMPEVSGAEAFAAIRKINPRAKILISSGYSPDEQIHQIMDGGADGFIMKPFLAADLSHKIAEIMAAS